MAKIDTINIGSHKIDCLNLSETVGGAGVNKIGDVMVIQALMNYIASGNEDHSLINLGTSLDELPGVAGDFDMATYSAIIAFKRSWAHRLLNPSDSLIHPAYYSGRVLRRYQTGRLMVITLLSQLADDVSRQIAGVPYIERIFHIYPNLRAWIQDDDLYHSGHIIDDANLFQSIP
jgi:hypothetical protein